MPSTYFSELGDFFKALRSSLADGVIFLGGPLDIFLSILDIIITSFVMYQLLLILRDSRAWQLLRGILLIFLFAFLASSVGLNTVWYLLSRTIPILAIAIIIIFQPELRRTLETVGRSRFHQKSGRTYFDDPEAGQIIESIVSACDAMSKTRTGALIILERNTRLGEFENQENAVALDAAVTSTLLRQIFYTNSPLHDGAVLIRDGRVAVARVHVPLADVYHLNRDYGLRHRAAIGASELGDAVAVVVSEEKGTIGIAYDGVLHILENSDALRAQLQRLYGGAYVDKPSFSSWFKNLWPKRHEEEKEVSVDEIYRQKKDRPDGAESDAVKEEAQEDGDVATPGDPSAGARRRRPTFAWFSRMRHRAPRFGSSLTRRQRITVLVISIVIAVISWFYVQITVNPLAKRTFAIPMTHVGVDALETRGLGVQSLPVPTVDLVLYGRQRTLDGIDPNTIVAYIDLSDIAQPGMVTLPVEIKQDTPWYVKTDFQYPTSIVVNIYETDGIGD